MAQATERAERAEEARREAEQERDAALDEAAAAVASQRDAEAQLATSTNSMEDLEVAVNDLRSENSRLETKLQVAEDILGGPVDATSQPPIAGFVTGINNSISPGLVALNVGSEKGVKRGMTFEIYSEDSYKGRVRVASVVGDKCAAEILINPDGVSIERGDYASTNL